MPTYTLEDLFKEQLESGRPLTEEDPAVKDEREDAFGNQYKAGDRQLFILLVEGKISGIQDTEIKIESINSRSFDRLFEEYVYEPQWDSRTHEPINTKIPRFVQKPFGQKPTPPTSVQIAENSDERIPKEDDNE